ncbi:MAG: hypothetical protein ACR2RF_16010 [Geminicoccaceae bacterium]
MMETLRCVIGLLLISGLGACQSGSTSSDQGGADTSGYPSLHSVPVESRPSSSIEDRRQIVRTLLDERDQSRRQTAIVRGRSGLSVDPPPVSAAADARAEDIVPDASGGEGAFRLRPESNDDASTVYRSDSQLDDGGLDDFIRQLKRDTQSQSPENAPVEIEEPAPLEPDEDDVSALPSGSYNHAGVPDGFGQSLLLAAFAPAVVEDPWAERDVVIRLAAAEEEPGFFCSYLGWMIAWSSICVAGTDAGSLQGSDDDVGADLEQELRQSPEEESSVGATGSRSAPSSEAGRERAERRLSEEDAAEAIEDSGGSALAPVTNSLEKLRDFMKSRQASGAGASSSERAPSYRSEVPPTRAAEDRAPIPKSRPRRREDLAIDDKGERFEFSRTPLPAYKPTPDEPIILKAKAEHRSESKPIQRADPPPEPHLRPIDHLVELKGEGTGAEDRGAGNRLADRSVALAMTTEAMRADEPALTSTSSTKASPDLELETLAKAPVLAPEYADQKPVLALDSNSVTASLKPEPQAATEQVAIVIVFEPETPGLPKGLGPRLRAVLEDARGRDQKIHIIGEASTNHLARRRATDVGAALVQLGATVEILEYDHGTRNDVDRVRLVLEPAASGPLPRASEPAALQK